MEPVAYPAESVEGWYALHQMYTVDRAALREVDSLERDLLLRDAAETLESLAAPDGGGWTRVVPLTGSRADVMLVHFRATFDALGEAQRAVQGMALADFLDPAYSFLSVAEAGMYHLTAKVVRETREAGGKVGDAAFRERLTALMAKEAETEHVRKRLYPEVPTDMPYVCFYPMDKKREHGQNWYTLPVEERSRLMQEHGMSGRRYAGRVSQVVTGAIGFDAWEWGVTLFARDPLEFKKIVTEMRFDEASAKYGEFGEFFVGKVAEPEDWMAELL
jgi:peroxiredoxin